jgi:AcrR family transcriptional regulator
MLRQTEGKEAENMGEYAEDRRSRRSRKLLKQGLLELMQEKRFQEISVRDVTERMDLNRGTFYLHYPNTTALLRSIEADMLAEAQDLIDAHLQETVACGTLQPVFEPILDYVVSNREICTILFANNSSSNFTDRLHEVIRRNGTDIIQARFAPASQAQLEYLLSFITYGLIGLMKEWFDREMDLPKKELIAAADRLVNGASECLLGEKKPAPLQNTFPK